VIEQPYVPPPEVPPPVMAPPPVIANVAPTPPPVPVVIAPPAPPVVIAPPAPPKPAIRQGVSCTKRDPPSFPREAIRAHVEKGHVDAVLTIDEKGNVSDVQIVTSSPPRVFDRVVRDTLAEWKCAGEGAKYKASVEINFTLTD
jgi:protein TonB